MENFDNQIFGFGANDNNDLEQANSFNYNSMSGLGESDYENEDLFVDEPEFYENLETKEDVSKLNEEANNQDDSNIFAQEVTLEEYETEDKDNIEHDSSNLFNQEISDDILITENQPIETIQNLDMFNEESSNESAKAKNYDKQNQEELKLKNDKETANENTIVMTKTTKEELNELTKYKNESLESTDISSLFDKVSVNVKDASDIFRKNADIKKRIDNKFEELKKLQIGLENSRKKQMDEIDKYKEEVLAKLTEKKDEIEKRLNLLKETQNSLEKQKREFEQYKKQEQEKITKVQKQIQSAYDDRREELNHIEDALRKQKDELDEERSQLSLDKIQYESDKNELANNLLKFNELVNSFTNGVNSAGGE